MKPKAFLHILIVLVLLVGAYLTGSTVSKNNSGATDIDSNNFPLLAKRIFQENPNNVRINFSELRASLRQYFAQNEIEGTLYFEYLPTGTSVRVNGDTRYRAASLIKLPVAMELFRAQELGLVDLDEKRTLKSEWLNDNYGELYKRGEGYELSLRELATILLTDSDNTALRAIIETTDAVLGINDRALGALDIEFTLASDQSIDVGTRSYSSFLKCLYFACYNTPENSQTILNLLTITPFDDRLKAGISDDNIPVAHKIGVFNTQVQSDCGIIYVPQKNYVLCIMLEDSDDDSVNSHFAALSKITFEYIDKQ